MLQGFLVALVSALIYLESRLVGQHMLDRPIIIGPVVGLIMGDPVTGLVVGGQLELVWMGLNGIGTTTPPNVVVGSALATALAISTGASYETTLALAVPIAVVAQLCDIAAPIVNTFFAHQADRFADQENYRGATAFMIGNEGAGLSDELTGLADRLIRIPMEGQVESLNAAVSAAILMYEAGRQRRKKNGRTG